MNIFKKKKQQKNNINLANVKQEEWLEFLSKIDINMFGENGFSTKLLFVLIMQFNERLKILEQKKCKSKKHDVLGNNAELPQ